MMSKSDPPPSSSPKESGGLCLLIDTSSYLFRAYHAVADLHTRGGSPTGAIYGVVSMLRKLLRQYPAQFAACVMDTKEKTFRHRLFPKYKANRPPMDPELAAQIAPVGEFVRAMGFAQVAQDGLEADDLIASLVPLIRAQKITVIISSGDKDLTQLVGEGVTMVDSLREKFTMRKACAKNSASPRRRLRIIWRWSATLPTTFRALIKSAPKPPPSGSPNSEPWIICSRIRKAFRAPPGKICESPPKKHCRWRVN